MLPTGSKLLLGGALLAVIGAVVYGLTQEGSLGTVGLISAAVALTFLAGVDIFIREGDVSAMDAAALTDSAAAATPPGQSVWPFIAGAGAVLVAVGLVTYEAIFIFGILALLAAGVDWMIQAYSERASADVGFNRTIRGRIAHPLEFPILAAVGVAIIVYSFSRIMLMLSKTSGPAVFGTIAAVLLVIGFVIAFVPSIKSGAVAIIAVIASIGLVAGGAAGAIQGEREMHHHETTGQLAAEGECDTPDETPADENASQAVAAKANIAAELTLTGDGTLEVENLGVSDPDAPSDRVSIPRSNVTNVLFTNESPEARRLVLDLGTRPEVDPATGDTVPDTEVPNQLCTQLAEEDGTQLLTFSINTPSAYAKEPYRFVVPGVDGAEVLVMVS